MSFDFGCSQTRESLDHDDCRWSCTHHYMFDSIALHVAAWVSGVSGVTDSLPVGAIWDNDGRMIEQPGGSLQSTALPFKEALEVWDCHYGTLSEEDLNAAIEGTKKLLEEMA